MEHLGWWDAIFALVVVLWHIRLCLSQGTGAVQGDSCNSATRDYSTVSGGLSNTAIHDYAVVGGRSVNTAVGRSSFIGGRAKQRADKSYATVTGSKSNTAGDWGTFIGGGGAYADDWYKNTQLGLFCVLQQFDERSCLHSLVMRSCRCMLQVCHNFWFLFFRVQGLCCFFPALSFFSICNRF